MVCIEARHGEWEEWGRATFLHIFSSSSTAHSTSDIAQRERINDDEEMHELKHPGGHKRERKKET